MVIDIKMCRFDNVPWGFRLVGGSDFEIPLTVVKVAEGSLAEEAGLRVDDVIVRINDDTTSPMTHDEAHKIISHCGNVFYLGVYREDAESDKENFFPINENLEPKLSRTPDSLVDSSIKSQIDELPSEGQPQAIEEEEGVLAEEPGSKIEDEEIASLLSTEAEVLKEHNVLGIFPKPGVCQSSEVIRQLNEEANKTKEEKDKDKKKWTTFMQKPNRPIPKSKQQLEAEARAANAYKVNIVKNYKKPEPVRPPSPIPEPEPEIEEPPKAPTPPPEVEEEPPTDSEVPNLEQSSDDAVAEEAVVPQNDEDEEVPKSDENKEVREESIAKDERVVESVDREGKAPSESDSLREKTEEELQLERQLADVQRQLLALANLPSTIQSTLDAVTKQLSELLPTFKLQPNIAKEATPDRSVKEQETQEEIGILGTEIGIVENQETLVTSTETVEEVDKSLETIETQVTQADYQEIVKAESEIKQVVEEKIQVIEVSERNLEEEQMEEEQNLKRKKIELWNSVFNKGNIARKFFRVNFMKYQKPEKKIDLDKSEVYKVIHHLDKSPVRGIEVRPPVVVAEADVRRVIES